jgi:uncharacterized protein
LRVVGGSASVEHMTTETLTAPARIAVLDLLRGLGVLGILAVNAAAFAYPFEAYQNPMNGPFPFVGAEALSWFVVHVFFELKFITLFSMLFGVSLYLVGGERTDLDKGKTLRRRLFWLLLFGLIHGALLWFGDILLAYALTGFVILLCRSWRARTLMTWGVVLLVISSLPLLGLAVLAFAPVPADQLLAIEQSFWRPPEAAVLETIGGFRGDFWTVQSANAEIWSTFATFGFVTFTFWRTAAVMMIGLALFKMGVLRGEARGSTYWTLIVLGGLSLAAVGLVARQHMASGFAFPEAAGLGALANYFLSPLITLGYVGVITLLWRAKALGIVGHALSAVGRMAFTNYIAQTLIMTALFFGGRGPVLFAEVDRAGLWAIVVGIWIVQLVWSPLWLARFHYGPLEWVWRRLTNGGAKLSPEAAR